MDKKTILVCGGTACTSSKSPLIFDALKEKVEKEKLDVVVKKTGCHGFCQRGPIVVIEPEGTFYTEVKVDDVDDIVESDIKKGVPVERLFYRESKNSKPIQHYKDIPFYKNQFREIILRNCGKIDPEDIDDYIATGGYEALKKALLKMKAEDVIDEVKKSGLRGRGGAGFPTGTKWKYCRDAKSEANQKYMICNADEGDPGAFMDRSILEADPHTVLEGMIIAAYAIGASKGYIYIREEYPLAIKRFSIALEQARERGFLGKNILGSDFSFSVETKMGAGAFVCGEETALIASIEGKRGMPRPRPPFPAQKGLWGQPTNINNVKTLASVPVIISRGAEWFASIGSKDSKGTAVFALTGKIVNSGLVEIPMGTELRSIIYDIGGGVPDGKKLKAVQTGGPSGGCIPAHLAGLTFDYESLVQEMYIPANYVDLPIDYETLARVGSIMGSGGMVVMDEDTCMVDVAHFFLSFTQYESCGKCPTCRIGTKKMKDILEKIMEGRGEMKDLDLLEELAITVKNGSLCGLGQTAPNPVLTTLRYFRDEYIAHIKDKRCPAKVCKSLIWYEIDEEKCIGCGTCAKNCSANAIEGELKKPYHIDVEKCVKCGVCFQVCPVGAVKKETGKGDEGENGTSNENKAGG